MNQEKLTVLVVDDVPENIEILRAILHSQYKVKAARTGEKALKIARSTPPPDMILLDVVMPLMDGYEVCKRLKSDPATAEIPIIFITAKNSADNETLGLELGAVDYITKPVVPAIVKARVSTQLALRDQQHHLEELVLQRTMELQNTRLELIQCLGQAAEYKDNETGLHVIRMSHYSRIIAQQLDADSEWVQLVFQASPMHDVGKIGIPDSILSKPGKLTSEEWDIMRMHPEYGAQIIGNHPSRLLSMAREIALTHHEKWDGSGYPFNLSGEDIPLSGRVVAVADVFDALTSERPYKKAWAVEDAVAFIQENAGKHFDPKLVDIFIKELPAILEIKNKYAESAVTGTKNFSHMLGVGT
ncbi:two-component system response regulator [Halodesulfovibrio sp.]|uniref:response regulator n=1 Tax=Halodesulfovibrio sp. TaxID=1912772 RepID=UPI0025F02448|nr:two-component system response regulator [Halodesulfovibrio sp.]MCT4534139.1 two-component system response regulator [Halodesulfovibrio sp.]MCT4625903.1 two-component system response regulator [Halodesulfovibrio sp.]